MLRANNYSVIFNPEGPPVEQNSFTCGHCQAVTFVKPGQRADDTGGLCKVCMNLICPACTDLLECDVFEKKLERAEARDRMLRSMIGL
jgi:hypothetical protein